MSDLVHIASLYLALDGIYVAESIDPPVCARGNTAAIALLNLRIAIQQNEPKSNVVAFRRRSLR